MCERLDQLLPIFLAVTSNVEATKRLILMKFMFQDQLEMLPQNKYVISLEHMQKLREHFTRYFAWIKNAMGSAIQMPQQGAGDTGNAQLNAATLGNLGTTPTSASSPNQPQSQVPSLQPAQNVARNMANAAKPAIGQNNVQQQMQQPAVAQQQQQQPAANIAGAAHAGLGLKHTNIDLKLPASKRQKSVDAATNGAQQPPQQQPQASQASPASVAASASPQNDQLDAVAQNDPTAANRHVNGQLIIQAAIAAGYPPQVVVRLPQKALQANWLLQKAAQGKTAITAAQQQQIQQMLNGMVEQVKQQLANEANNGQTMPQAAVTQAVDNRQPGNTHVIDLESSPTPGGNANVMDLTVDTASVATGVNQQALKQEADTPMAAMAFSTQLGAPQPAVDIKLMNTTNAPLSATPVDLFSTVRPGMTADGRVVNANIFTADILKDLVNVLGLTEGEQDVLASDVMQNDQEYECVEDTKGGMLFEATATSTAKASPAVFAPFSDHDASIITEDGDDDQSFKSSNWYSIGMDPQIPDMSEYLHGFDILECS